MKLQSPGFHHKGEKIKKVSNQMSMGGFFFLSFERECFIPAIFACFTQQSNSVKKKPDFIPGVEPITVGKANSSTS